jgi:hypothetical protein
MRRFVNDSIHNNFSYRIYLTFTQSIHDLIWSMHNSSPWHLDVPINNDLQKKFRKKNK